MTDRSEKGALTVDGFETLQDLLSALETAGVKLHIISIGMKAAIVPHLNSVGLLRFFADERIWGQDCPRHSKRSALSKAG